MTVSHPATPRGRAVRRFRVTVTAGPSRGATWTALAPRCAIGSHPSNDLVIDEPTVSRFHCELAIAGSRVRVRDLGSRNGTHAGGVAITDATIAGGIELALGRSRIQIAVDDLATELAASPHPMFGKLVGASCVMREVFAQLERTAASDATVLIEGETGTGKEGVAEALHDAGARSGRPFVVVDCGAIPAGLLESELFGHEAGAFTNAVEQRIGVFERASGGTLVLDEIGELPMELQPTLLRALEAREIRRVGGAEPLRCDVRIIAATNRDLRGEVNRGTFRADLYYRLAVVQIRLPPLRDRTDDLPLLVDHLARGLGAPPELLAGLAAPPYIAALAAAPWPGNVRELRNHLQQCIVFGAALARTDPAVRRAPVDAELPYELARRAAIDDFERTFVTALLERTADNVSEAARTAGVNRAYLYRLLRRHGLR